MIFKLEFKKWHFFPIIWNFYALYFYQLYFIKFYPFLILIFFLALRSRLKLQDSLEGHKKASGAGGKACQTSARLRAIARTKTALHTTIHTHKDKHTNTQTHTQQFATKRTLNNANFMRCLRKERGLHGWLFSSRHTSHPHPLPHTHTYVRIWP